jgi:hypothetical protein
MHLKGEAQGEAHPYPIPRMPSPKGFSVHKAQLLNILNQKSSSSQKRNFHGYKVPFPYTMKMIAMFLCSKKF